MTVETDLAAHVLDVCEVDASLPARPSNLTQRLAFVSPSDVWKQFDDDGGFCTMEVGLDVYLVAGSADFGDSFAWLDEQTTILMQSDPLTTDDGDQIAPVEVPAPFVFSDSSGASYLTARVTYSRYRI